MYVMYMPFPLDGVGRESADRPHQEKRHTEGAARGGAAGSSRLCVSRLHCPARHVPHHPRRTVRSARPAVQRAGSGPAPRRGPLKRGAQYPPKPYRRAPSALLRRCPARQGRRLLRVTAAAMTPTRLPSRLLLAGGGHSRVASANPVAVASSYAEYQEPDVTGSCSARPPRPCRRGPGPSAGWYSRPSGWTRCRTCPGRGRPSSAGRPRRARPAPAGRSPPTAAGADRPG